MVLAGISPEGESAQKQENVIMKDLPPTFPTVWTPTVRPHEPEVGQHFIKVDKQHFTVDN